MLNRKPFTFTDLVKGGPYIGKRGGKWADPQHTIAWKEDTPKKGGGKSAPKGVVEHHATRGGRHEIKIHHHGDGDHSVKEYTRGEQTASSSGHTLESAKKELARRVNDAKTYDNISYTKKPHAAVAEGGKSAPIGKTTSGKPIHASKHEGKGHFHKEHQSYTRRDHSDAAKLHEKHAQQSAIDVAKVKQNIKDSGGPGSVKTPTAQQAKLRKEWSKHLAKKVYHSGMAGAHRSQADAENSIAPKDHIQRREHTANAFAESAGRQHGEAFGKSLGTFSDLVKAAYYVGPRGGKWADAKHTIAWKEDKPKKGFFASLMSKIKGKVASFEQAVVSQVSKMTNLDELRKLRDELVGRIGAPKPQKEAKPKGEKKEAKPKGEKKEAKPKKGVSLKQLLSAINRRIGTLEAKEKKKPEEKKPEEKKAASPNLQAAGKVDRPQGFLMGQSWSSLMAAYDKNEDKNRHSENATMLAEAFGLSKDVIDELKSLAKKRDTMGSLTLEDTHRQVELTQGLWGIATEKAEEKPDFSTEKEPLPFNKRAEAGLLDTIGKELADKSRQVEAIHWPDRLQSPTKVMSIKEQFLFQASKMAQDLAQGKSKEDAIALFEKQAEPKLAAMAEKAYDAIQQQLAQLKAKAEDNFETMPESGGRIATKDLKHGEKYALRRETRPGEWKESPVIYQGTSRGRHIFEHMGGDGSEQYILENSERSMLIPWTKKAAEKKEAKKETTTALTPKQRKKMKREMWSKQHKDFRSDTFKDNPSIMIGPGAHRAMGEDGHTALQYLDGMSDEKLQALYDHTFRHDAKEAKPEAAEKQRPRLAEQMASIGATAVGGKPEKKAVSGKPSSFPLGDAEWDLLSKLKAAGDHSAEAKKLLKENPDAAFKLKENTMIGLFAGGLNTDVTDKFFAEKKRPRLAEQMASIGATAVGGNPDAALVADYHEATGAYSVGAIKKINARAQELLPGIRVQEALDVVAMASEHGGKLPAEFVEQMIRENRVTGKKAAEKKEAPKTMTEVVKEAQQGPGAAKYEKQYRRYLAGTGRFPKSLNTKYASGRSGLSREDMNAIQEKVNNEKKEAPISEAGKPKTAKEKKAPESRGMLSNEDRLKEIHNDGYLATPHNPTLRDGAPKDFTPDAERHAAHEKQHKELVESGHLEHLGHGVYADKAPPKAAKGKKGTVGIDQGFDMDKDEKKPKKDTPATIYGKGDWAITKDPERKGKSRVTNVASGLGFGGDMTGPQASYVMDHLMEMEGKGELDGFDPNNMSSIHSKKATEAIKKLNDHAREESNNNNPIWTRRGKAKTEANRRGKVADAEKTVADTAGRKSKPMSEATKKHDSVESAHKRSSQFESGDETRPSLMQSYVDEHQGERHMVSTDGHRLAMIPVSKDVAEGHYKPKKEGRKKVGLDHQKPGSYDADTFPDYTKIIPQNMTKENTHTFDAEALHAQAHLASTNASGSTTVMHLFTDEGGSHAQGSHTAAYSPHADEKDGDMHGQRHTAAEPYKGKEKGVTFNPRYLKDALEGAKGPVEVHYTGPDSPIHVKRGDGERHIIMPIRADKLPPKHPHNPATGRASTKGGVTKKSLDTFTDLVKNIDTVRSYMAEGMSARAATKKAYPTYPEAKVDKFLKQYGLNKALGFTKLVQQSPKIYHRRQPGKYGSE